MTDQTTADAGTQAASDFGPFFSALTKVSKGAALDRVNSALNAVALGVQTVGKKGTVTVTLTLEPSDADPRAVAVDAKVKATVPEHTLSGMFFVDDDGNLTRTNPDDRQEPLPGVNG